MGAFGMGMRGVNIQLSILSIIELHFIAIRSSALLVFRFIVIYKYLAIQITTFNFLGKL